MMCTGKYRKYYVLCIVQWITSEINEGGKYTSTIRKRKNKLLTWRALFSFNTSSMKIWRRNTKWYNYFWYQFM